MDLNTVQEIERAIDALPPQELAELYAWLDRQRPQNPAQAGAALFEQGLAYLAAPMMPR